MRKAVFFDIDGTLIDCLNGMNDMSDEVKKAIRELQTQGNYAFIASGRPYAFLSEEILKFGFDGFVLANGAEIIMDNKIIYAGEFDKEFVKEVTDEFDSLGIQYILEGEHYSYIKREHKDMWDFYMNIGISSKLIMSDFDVDKLHVLKAETLCSNKEIEDKCIDIMDRNPQYGYFHSIGANTFEIYNKENTKASAIIKLLEYLNISRENSFAFGDGTNDIEMLSEVGCGIAMGNASDYVKSFAHKVTDTVYEDGAAKGIYKYILD